MINWIKKNKCRFTGNCLLVFTLATALPTIASYGVFNTDLRPLLLVIDALTSVAGISLIVAGDT
jgi:hypothetical protein